MSNNISIFEVERHRNGSSGAGFYAIRFYDKDENREMVAVVFGYRPKRFRNAENPNEFDDPVYFDPHVAVLDTELVRETVEFGVNSWRGGHYAHAMYDAIDDYWDTFDERLRG